MEQADNCSFRHTHASLLEQLSDLLGEFFSDPDYQSHELPNDADNADEIKSLTALLDLLAVLLGKLFLHLIKLPADFDTEVNVLSVTSVNKRPDTNVTSNSFTDARHRLSNFSIFRESNHSFTPSTASFLWPFPLLYYAKGLLRSSPPTVKALVNMRFYSS
ncbi:hypothetical protein [Geofilum rhodophaeum]|uniref:hypothetical protein n=1 Tax=Geofilum rhodophaeum TaxID=1965019 RepID=UPI0011BA5B5C|nr:hypothetical protein [Geofilum rhodophaeum]